MSNQLPLPTIDYDIALSTSSIQISLEEGSVLWRYRKAMELGDENLAVAWVLHDILRDLDKTIRKQSAI